MGIRQKLQTTPACKRSLQRDLTRKSGASITQRKVCHIPQQKPKE